VVLFSSPWELEYFGRQHPNVELLSESPLELGGSR
jgi:hypothetical protein